MKILPVLFVLLGIASSYPVVKTWSLPELSEALVTSKHEPSLRPYLEDALNQIMLALFTGKNGRLVHAVVPSPTGEATWTLAQVKKALADPNTKPDHRSGLLQAQAFAMNNNSSTNEINENIEVTIPALDISTWTKLDLYEAILNPDTKAELRPYLEKARKDLKKALAAGENRDTVSIVTPVGLVPAEQENVLRSKPSKHSFKKYIKGL